MSDRSPSPVPESQPSVGPADDELVRRALMGSVSAFEELVAMYGPQLYSYLAVRVRNESDARDALQETLTAAWQGLSDLREPSKFRAWLFGIAAHKATDAVRARPGEHMGLPSLSLDDASVLEIRDALDHLPAHYREMLVLRYGLQFTEDEVAEILGIRRGTVKSRSSRARRALLEQMR